MGTELFLSEEFYYKNGFEFKCNVECKLVSLGNPSYYKVEVPAHVKVGEKIKIEIKPKKKLGD